MYIKPKYRFKKLVPLLSLICSIAILACKEHKDLHVVSVAEFDLFIKETDYKTDAEKFGWSIIQEDIHSFRTSNGVNWKIPNAEDSAHWNFPVTQVSFNDAVAYCKWAGTRLPSYTEYWNLARKDGKLIHKNSKHGLPVNQVNVVGNVWDITNTEDGSENIRLAGGSYLCNESSCNGTDPNRKLFVDKATGNIHIGFSVISK